MAKSRKQFILDPAKIRKAKKLLGVSTETEAVDTALDILLGNAEIADLHRKLSGKLNLKDMDQSKFGG